MLHDVQCQATPHWFDVIALWQMPQGNLVLRGPGLSSMSCMNRSMQM